MSCKINNSCCDLNVISVFSKIINFVLRSDAI